MMAGRPSACQRSDRPRAAQEVGHATADVADIGRARPEILVVDGGQLARLLVGAVQDRDVGARARTRSPRAPGRRSPDPGRTGPGPRRSRRSRRRRAAPPGGRAPRGRSAAVSRAASEPRPLRSRVGRGPSSAPAPGRPARARSARARRAAAARARRRASRPARRGRCGSSWRPRRSGSAGRDRVGQGAQQQGRRRRARVLVPDAPLAEVRRAALGRQERDRGDGAGLGGIGHRRG